MASFGGYLADLLVPPPLLRAGSHPPDQAAQGPMQPGLVHLQGWGTQTSLGNLFQHLTCMQ